MGAISSLKPRNLFSSLSTKRTSTNDGKQKIKPSPSISSTISSSSSASSSSSSEDISKPSVHPKAPAPTPAPTPAPVQTPAGKPGKKGRTQSHVKSRNPAFIVPLIPKEDAHSIVRDCGELGVDPSSTKFANRTKNIAFVLSLNGQWFQVNQNYFNQAEEYNDFSGGYKRFYDELPREFIQNTAAQRLLTKFRDLNKIQDGELILVQVQSSNITAADEGKCLTGQGIHSDGADKAMLICLERNNVKGAKSSVYEDIYGEKPIISPRVVKEGQVLFWRDNEIYHYVEPAKLEDKSKPGKRTVMIAHYPAMQYVTGEPNPNNTLPPSGFHPPHINHPKL